MNTHLQRLYREFRNARQLALAVLREIFDEAAYERFLIRHGLEANSEGYAAFRRDHEDRKARRPRCC